MKVVTLVHRIFTPGGVKTGGADYITAFLENRGFEVVFIEHPLIGAHCSRIKRKATSREYKLLFSGPIRWATEIVFNVWHLLSSAPIDLIIAVDPLNFLAAYFARFVIKTPIQFHAIDYSENRFGIKPLDYLYRKTYHFAISQANFVTYVSVNMRELIVTHIKEPSKAKFLPNSPDYEQAPRIDPTEKNPYELVYTKSKISEREAELLTQLTALLKKRFPQIKLHVIGQHQQSAPEHTQKARLEQNIIWHGLVDYQKNLQLMSRAYVGIAWYENINSFEKYADSLKIREYAASGLPVICNRNISTASEASEKGLLLLCDNVHELAQALESLITNKMLYMTMRDRALAWARDNDKKELLCQLYSSIGLI